MRAWLTFAAVALAAPGCKDLPEIPAGVCGNHVIEPPEDCDGFAQDGVPCRPPGGVNQCRLDCSADENGVAAMCPTSWGCFEGEVCRPATGKFIANNEPIPGNAWSLIAGDFDGNGSHDVVGLERPVSQGFTKARIHYFGDRGEPIGTYTSEKLMGTPTVSDVTRDSRSDLVYSFGSILVVAGEANRSLLTETYPSYLLGEFPSRVLFVTEQAVDMKPGIVVFGRLGPDDGIFVFDPTSPFLRPVVELEAGVDALAADPMLGDIFEDDAAFPCTEFVLAYRDAREFSVYSLCEAGPDGLLHWKSTPYVEIVRLDPPALIERGIVVADLDGDGHLDVIVGTDVGPYVAYGDGQELGSARPHIPMLDEHVAPDAMPLAAGDITGDRIADLVYPEGLVVSIPTETEGGEPSYATIRPRYGPRWSEARFADLNADGFLDVACASNTGLDIDFFNGTGTIAINRFTIPTQRPTEHLAVRDFDGDLVDDLAFVELRDPSRNTEQISIAFGQKSGGPEAPVPAAHLEDVEQIAAFADDPTSTISNMIIVYSQTTGGLETEYALSFLVGSSDRVPASPVELTTFAADGSVQDSTSAALTLGSFRDPNQLDVMPFALAYRGGDLADAPPEMWLLENITEKSHSPQFIGWNLDERTRPIGGPSSTNEISARLAAKDLDGDSLDELVFVAPSDDAEALCIVNVASVSGEPPVLELRDAVALDTPCYETVVEIADLDADEAPDIVVLVGELKQGPREPLVLWNDGQGRFSSEDSTSIATGGDNARSFTAFRAFDGSTLFALVTEQSLRTLRPLGADRAFGDERTLGTLELGSGVVAADVNGDGIVDLAVADAGSTRIFHAELLQ